MALARNRLLSTILAVLLPACIFSCNNAEDVETEEEEVLEEEEELEGFFKGFVEVDFECSFEQ